MTYWKILWDSMKDTIHFGGIVSIIATWGIILIGPISQFSTMASLMLMFWPVLFVLDALVSFYIWKTQ